MQFYVCSTSVIIMFLLGDPRGFRAATERTSHTVYIDMFSVAQAISVILIVPVLSTDSVSIYYNHCIRDKHG